MRIKSLVLNQQKGRYVHEVNPMEAQHVQCRLNAFGSASMQGTSRFVFGLGKGQMCSRILCVICAIARDIE